MIVQWYWNYIVRSTYVMLRYRQGKPVQKYAGKHVMNTEESNDWIKKSLRDSETPFCVTRFGSVELNVIRKMLAPYCGSKKRKMVIEQFCNNAGFFYDDESDVMQFVNLILPLLSEVDMLAKWDLPMEEYMLKKYFRNDVQISEFLNTSSFLCDSSWTTELEGKKVLVIHPFTDTIKKQYLIRDKLFEREVLPEFELICIKAVQTIGQERDSRFATWFSALDYMYNEAMKVDFDVALIGCGAYGMPLALKLKKAGKSVIHMGGVLQILFGIKGKRWDAYNLYNEYWCRPKEEERPLSSARIEDGCYW